jgi:hypothetical protein
MTSNTERLGLLKKDPVIDGADTFNIETMLNENWDKIDQRAALLDPVTGKVPADQLNVDTSDLTTKTEFNVHLADEVKHITATERNNWNNKSNFSGSFNDLTNKPSIPTVSTSVSSTSTTTAASSSAVKAAYDKAVSAANTAGEAPKFASGNYSGDNTNNRFINVGFTPKLLIITRTSSTSDFGTIITTIFQGDSKTDYLSGNSRINYNDGGSLNGITTNGFYASYDSNLTDGSAYNQSGRTFHWVAFA